jgi:lipopolysaccharide/colanic/teichoic acid biosynthesis glycosyltransferase
MIIKRIFDIIFSIIGMTLLLPILLPIALSIKSGSNGPIFFRQNRVGLEGKIFQIHKLRTMYVNSEKLGKITIGKDKRITNFGKWLRKYKIDELPQLIDVFIGDMSIVGPRPEVKEYVDIYPINMRKKILSVRPGITDLASIEMINESLIMAKYSNPHDAYINKIMPLKLNLCAKYVDNRTIFLDVKIIFLTFKNIILTK